MFSRDRSGAIGLYDVASGVLLGFIEAHIVCFQCSAD